MYMCAHPEIDASKSVIPNSYHLFYYANELFQPDREKVLFDLRLGNHGLKTWKMEDLFKVLQNSK